MRKRSRIILAVLAVTLFSLTPLLATAPKQAEAQKKAAAARTFTGPQTLVGKISMVQVREGLVVVKDSNGVPFDFKVAHAKIEIDGQRGKMTNLSADINKAVSVKYIPLASGDVAQTIVVKG